MVCGPIRSHREWSGCGRASASFRAVVGEAPVILRVEAGRKVIRGAVFGEVQVGGLALMPAGVPLDVENHPPEHGPYRATG